MNRKTRSKLIIALWGMAIFIPLSWVVFWGLSDFLASFNEGADPASIFRGHQLILPESEQARYVPNENLEGKTPTQAEREEILAAYWLAWDVLARAHQTQKLDDLPTYWAGSALQFAQASIDDGTLSQFDTSNHTLRLVYLADDGSVVSLIDESFNVVRSVDDTQLTLTASASVLMTLDNGFWRIRLIEIDYRR